MPSDGAVILYGAGLCTGFEERHTKFTLSAGTYSVEDFNTKIKAAVLQQRQDWEMPQIKDLKLVIPEHSIFMASNFFIALGVPENYLKKTIRIKSTLPPGTYKTSVDTLPPLKLLLLHCNHQAC